MPKTLAIPVITEIHQATRVRAGSVQVACCDALAEDYGTEFILAADGGLIPASILVERVRLGKIVVERPRQGWKSCPFCDTRFVPNAQTVIKRQEA